MENAIAEDLNICVGCGVTKRIGSDSYPLYVSEVLPNGVIGMYRTNWHFEKNWTDGSVKVDPFDSSHSSEFYAKRRYGHWWKVEKNGKPIERITSKWCHLSFNGAYGYQDPSF